MIYDNWKLVRLYTLIDNLFYILLKSSHATFSPNVGQRKCMSVVLKNTKDLEEQRDTSDIHINILWLHSSTSSSLSSQTFIFNFRYINSLVKCVESAL